MTVDDFFNGQDLSRQLFDTVYSMVDEIGPVEIRVTKSQISLRRKKPFAWVWMPSKYLRGEVAPLVLTFVFHRKDASSRWKEIVEPSPVHFTHHLDLFSVIDIDDQVRDWMLEAWTNAK